jgi:hypothetical protein
VAIERNVKEAGTRGSMFMGDVRWNFKPRHPPRRHVFSKIGKILLRTKRVGFEKAESKAVE